MNYLKKITPHFLIVMGGFSFATDYYTMGMLLILIGISLLIDNEIRPKE